MIGAQTPRDEQSKRVIETAEESAPTATTRL
jgi:hypothetical protein